MGKRKFRPYKIAKLSIEKFAAEGKCIAKHDEKVIFIPFTAPGDEIEALITSDKKNFAEGKILSFIEKSNLRIEPKCSHFSICGGCKWQHISYAQQLENKQNQVKEQFDKIGKILPKIYKPIIGAEPIFEYRNKFEFSFSNIGWIEDIEDKSIEKKPAAGFHIPGRFDKVLDLKYCHLANKTINAILQLVKTMALSLDIPFYNQHTHEGNMRNLIVRTSTLGGLMVIIVCTIKDEAIDTVLSALKKQFTEITSLNYIINTKKNDTIYDLEVINISGEEVLYEQIGDIKYKIRPKSFFQTNSYQTKNLYAAAIALANLSSNDLVYDLYTGTGSIALYIARNVKKVVGIEILPQAIEDAKENAITNNITNCAFYVGDMRKTFTNELVNKEGAPDVLITDPPRNGMDAEVVEHILALVPKKVIYISCNPATQARDLQLLSAKYQLDCSQAVDMFPHTHHIENIVLLTLL